MPTIDDIPQAIRLHTRLDELRRATQVLKGEGASLITLAVSTTQQEAPESPPDTGESSPPAPVPPPPEGAEDFPDAPSEAPQDQGGFQLPPPPPPVSIQTSVSVSLDPPVTDPETLSGLAELLEQQIDKVTQQLTELGYTES